MKKIVSIILVGLICLLTLMACGSSREKELTFPNLDSKLQSGGNELKYTTYTEISKGSDKRLEIELDYKNEILLNGTVEAITNIVEEDLGKEYKDIKLTIMQEAPEYDFVEYKYDGESFEREK